MATVMERSIIIGRSNITQSRVDPNTTLGPWRSLRLRKNVRTFAMLTIGFLDGGGVAHEAE